MQNAQVNYSGVSTSALFAGDFNIRTGKVVSGKKEFVFTNKFTGGTTTRWIALERIGKDPEKEKLEQMRKRRQAQNAAIRAAENRARCKKR